MVRMIDSKPPIENLRVASRIVFFMEMCGHQNARDEIGKLP
ncbi:MAG: hypothetical protein ACYCVB_05825 [Bacilli bacterium]